MCLGSVHNLPFLEHLLVIFNLDSSTSLFFLIQFAYLINLNVIQLLKAKTVNKITNLFHYPVFDK